MKKLKLIALGAVSVALTGCYSLHVSKVDSLFGSSSDMQNLSVSTTPSGAQCAVTSYKDGNTATTVSITSPATVDIYQSMKPVLICCNKEGYSNAQLTLQPQSDGSFANTASLLLVSGS